MPNNSWRGIACLAFALAFSTPTFASTCTAGTASDPGTCQITVQDGLFTWTISDIQIVAADLNVTPSVLSISAVNTPVAGADQLTLSELLNPPNGLPAGLPLILDLEFDVSIAATSPPATGMPRTPSQPDNNEFQTYLNGLLLSTLSTNGSVPRVPGVSGTFLNTQTNIVVNDIFVVNENSGANMFSETFDIADPKSQSGNQTPPSAPEPPCFALIGLAAMLGYLLHSRFSHRQLPLVAHHNFLKDRR